MYRVKFYMGEYYVTWINKFSMINASILTGEQSFFFFFFVKYKWGGALGGARNRILF